MSSEHCAVVRMACCDASVQKGLRHKRAIVMLLGGIVR